MKLKNKETGEVVEVITGDTFERGGIQIRSLKRNPQIVRYYPSLAELNEEWEDYEEPKELKDPYFITEYGEVFPLNVYEDDNSVATVDEYKQIGNYFGSREEAEKAVEKLKAWKRLKDNGLEIKRWKFTPDMKHIKGNFVKVEVEIPYIVDNKADLDLLFGGEE